MGDIISHCLFAANCDDITGLLHHSSLRVGLLHGLNGPKHLV